MRYHCPRCGFESKRDNWAERHPFAAAVFGVPAFLTVVGVTVAHPWFAVPVLVVVCALLVNDAVRRRAAIAARADYEYRQGIAGAVFATDKTSPLRPAPAQQPAERPGHVMNRWPTTPLPTKPIRKGTQS
ncbi:hypothetical protein [Mycobacterium sp. 1465703.0]|uniref:hypothetical protein n=1 Tax=Mycobacterium sp. 1465703.0 TaxID=1834078 RepID=UPI0007FED8C5|nr:hypothetical protein [Mycobacterium sp. 1465703.0]OBJ08006.1 hypothetical protein A5625_15895 [Mycobacterium sp. 1465703.0]